MERTIPDLKKEIAERISAYENPKRVAFSRRYPALAKPILFSRRTLRTLQHLSNRQIRHTRKQDYFECIVARHQSLLRRKLGESDSILQERKVKNLAIAVEKLNGVVIQPGAIFSLWNIVGRPTYKKGYVDGMLLSNGKVTEGVGGGLCQLSNFLYWIFLHAPTETVERYHHSMDVFPDSGRTCPFGSGATILYNITDLKIRNTSPHPLQLKLWLTDTHLKGQLLAPERIPQKYHLMEKNHFFVKYGERYFRYNEIYREEREQGKHISIDRVTSNFAPVCYDVTNTYLKKNNFRVLNVPAAKKQGRKTAGATNIQKR